jgi:hypothetical protein
MSDNCQQCQRQSSFAPDANTCPFRMSDGRHFTDYKPRCLQNQYLRQKNNLPSSYDYRQYLITNASKLIEDERTLVYKENTCYPCFDFNEHGTMLPEINMVQCNDKVCNFKPGAPGGLGTGRRYDTDKTQPMPVYDRAALKQHNTYPVQGIPKTDYDKYGRLM